MMRQQQQLQQEPHQKRLWACRTWMSCGSCYSTTGSQKIPEGHNTFSYGFDSYPPTNIGLQTLAITADGIGHDFIAMAWPLPCRRDHFKLAEELLWQHDTRMLGAGHELVLKTEATDTVAAALLTGSMARAPDTAPQPPQQPSSTRPAPIEARLGYPQDALVKAIIRTEP